MTKKIIWFLALITITSSAFAGVIAAQEFNINADVATEADDTAFYLENSSITQLTVFKIEEKGKLISKNLTLPKESIISIQLSTFANRIDVNWICGVRIIDINDDQIRESEKLDEQNYCIRSSAARKLKLLDASSVYNKEAFALFQTTGNFAKLFSAATALKTKQEYLQRMLIAATPNPSNNIISPLKDCSIGCLKVTSEFGMRVHPVYKTRRMHKGIDFHADSGSPVVSVYAGKVLATRTEINKKTGKMKGYGRYVIIMHPKQHIETVYAHLSAFKTTVGKPVNQGELIALSGNSGIGTAPHLHFEVHTMKNGASTTVNPRKYVSRLLTVEM